ncbi:hypothetical protein BHM03_00037186 [Ensete ventricosum]|nr:hypothetical protein BHM03_00037186 [Ensete ventricosum]
MFPLRFPNNTNLASRRVLVDFKSRSVIPTRPLGQSSRTLSLGQSRWLQVMAGHTDFASRLVHADFKSWPVPSTSKSRFASFKSQLVIPTRPLVQSTSASSLGSCCQPQCRPKSQHSQNKADDQATFNHEPHPLESLKREEEPEGRRRPCPAAEQFSDIAASDGVHVVVASFPASPPRRRRRRRSSRGAAGTVTRHAPKITYAANTRNPQVDAAAQDSAAPNLSITHSTVLLKQVSSGCAAIRGVQCGQNPPLLVAPNGKQGIGEDSSK